MREVPAAVQEPHGSAAKRSNWLLDIGLLAQRAFAPFRSARARPGLHFWALCPFPKLVAPGSEHRPLRTARDVLPDGSVVILGPNVSFRVIVLKPGNVLVVSKGGGNTPADIAAVDALFREFDQELERSGTLSTFADARQSTQISSETREKTVEWARKHGDRIKSSHVLVRSKLIEMALSVVSLLIGNANGTKFYSRPDAFLAVMRGQNMTLTELPDLGPHMVERPMSREQRLL